MPSTAYSVKPVHYRITLEPDMINHRFAGTAEIRMMSGPKTDRVRLNALDLSITRCRYLQADKPISCPFRIEPEDETLTIELPGEVDGEFTVAIDYYGEITDSMAGFYRSRYTSGGQTYPIAVTQFQESDARRAFPCMDHPAHKAAFELAFVVDKRWTVLANTPLRSETAVGGDKKRVAFETTPVMSTYLLFFGLGDFRFVIDDLDRRVRAAVIAGMEQSVRYGLAFARKSLHYCENYYDIPFPLAKLDLIAVPDFAFGAMENWGAITFRENLLLHDPKITDVDGEERICEVIAHEMAHQWFGNLVTPSDWKYLWLNESFATYFGYGVVDHYNSEWRVWDTFVESQTEPAMSRDGLTDTTPIEIPGGRHVVINVSTAPIIYSKGGSILRQIEGFIGTEAFRNGLRDYLEKHAYACADSPDLWDALEAASGRPVSAIMKRWVEQAGHPLVTGARTGNRLTLRQQRFTYLASESETVWPVPLVIRVWDADGNERVITDNFDAAEMVIDLGADAHAYKINDQQAGFYRVAYEDAENWQKLLGMVETNGLSPLDRWGLVNDRYALVKADRIRITAFLDDLGHFANEESPLPLSAIFDALFQLHLVCDGPVRKRTADLEKRFLVDCLGRIGYLPRPGDNHSILRLRNKILWHAAFFELPGAASAVTAQFDILHQGGWIDPNIARSVMQSAAFMGDEKTFDWLAGRLESSESEHERLNVLRALGCFRRPHLIERVREFILKAVPPRNIFIPIASLAANPYTAETLWDWFVGNVGQLEKIHPIIFERIIAAIVPVCGLDRGEEVDAFFTAYSGQTDLAAPAIRMSLEKRAIYRRLRERSRAGE